MDSNITKLIGVTEQQFELLRAIDVASAKGGAKSKDIEQAYRKLTGKPIQKPNLFAQLRELQKQEFIVKFEGSYQINKTKLKQSLIKRKQEFSEAIDKCDKLSRELDKMFVVDSENTTVKFLPIGASIRKMVELLEESHTYARIAHIPAVAYSDIMAQLNDVREYSETMKERCAKGDLSVKYLVSLSPNRPFLKALSKFKDKERAYKEIENCYSNLIGLLKIPNLEFKYLSVQVESFCLFDTVVTHVLHASGHDILGSIFIENKEVYNFYKNMFDKLWENAMPLTEALVKQLSARNLKLLRMDIDRLTKDSGIKILNEDRVLMLTFDSLKDADDYLSQQIEKMTENKSGPFLAQVRHLWWPLIYSFYTEKNILSKLDEANIKFHCMYEGNKKLDKNIIEFYKKHGTLIVNCKKPSNIDSFVIWENAIQLYYPEALIRRIDKFYEKFNDLSNATQERFAKEIYDKSFKIKMVVSKDPEMVKEYERQILSSFK